VTTNLDAVLLENEALRHQVRLLREELALLQSSRSAAAQAQAQAQAAADFAGRSHPRQGAPAWRDEQEVARPQRPQEPGWRQAAPRGERMRSWRSGPEVTTGAAPGITPQLVGQWAEGLSSHPRWRELRLGSRLEGDPAVGGSLELGLQALLDRRGLLVLRDRLQEDRRRLQADNHSLQTDKTELEAENRRLETENRSLQAQVRRFKDAWRQIAHISGCALKDSVRAP
jgi:cell division protein FtsB